MPRASAVLAATIAALGAATPTSASAPRPQAPTPQRAWIAHLVRPVNARTHPDAAAAVTHLNALAQWNHGPADLLVLGTHTGPEGRTWVRVQLPTRPNHTSGWIPSDDTELRTTPWRVAISLHTRTVTLLKDNRKIHTYRAVIGAPGTPTPTGLYAISERIRQPNPNAFDGSWILLLTAYSNTLLHFGGGPGQIAIHGRGAPSLDTPLGTARSHGCIRINNNAINNIATVASEGTPVSISR